VAVATPEAAVVALTEDAAGHVDGRRLGSAAAAIAGADAVLVGPGLDDIDQAEQLLMRLPSLLPPNAVVVLDAFALGALRGHDELLRGTPGLILTPNKEEAAILLGRAVDDPGRDAAAIAERFHAIVICYGSVAERHGKVWRVRPGSAGLGTSGSGDVGAGIVAGLAARRAQPEQAAVWGAHLHAAAGDRAARRFGFLGYVASELLEEIPREIAAIERRR
jgi:NAD(P)H-hydrate repair Nnr-like enzyme with NAD(P)H-hydrate dehydratase domain